MLIRNQSAMNTNRRTEEKLETDHSSRKVKTLTSTTVKSRNNPTRTNYMVQRNVKKLCKILKKDQSDLSKQFLKSKREHTQL